MIYLDHAASTPLLNEALKVLSESYANDFANPSASHRLGKELAKKLHNSRENFKAMLGASSADQIIFCSSATEANNLIIKGLGITKEKMLVFTKADHPSLVFPAQKLSCQSTEFLLERGEISPQSFSQLFTKEVSLVLLSHVNNHSGNIQDIEKLSKLIKEFSPKVHIHVDASQSFTKIPIDLKKWNIDSLALSAHKMGGPRGIASLWIKKGVQLSPFWEGGGQEFSLRPSTEALPLILSFEEASKFALKKREENFQIILDLNLNLKKLLKEKTKGLLFPFENAPCSPFILTFIVPGISSDILLRLLEEKNIFVSSSSACSSKIKGHSSVFEALRIENQFHKNVLRVSLSPASTVSEIEFFVSQLSSLLNDLSFLKK